MIDRYNSHEISSIWSDHNKFQTYLDVELALLKSLEGDLIPEGTAKEIADKAVIDPKRIVEIEKVTKHDVIAFCTSITENLPAEVARFFHFGCTSSDIIDTATNLQIKASLELIQTQLSNLIESLKHKSENLKNVLCMGRSHGMNAEPMSFGSKFLSFYAEFSRRSKELQDYIENEITGQLSGAVGNYTVLNTQIEKKAIESLGLKVEPISTQVIPRDRILKLISITAMIASSMERLATEIRHLHHSDIGEVYEGFSVGQKGSSTMPHKKNPVSCENITGLSRVIRSHLMIAHENNTLWHERDISHSSAERLMLPDNLGLTFYALKRLNSTVENLVVNTEVIQNKVLNNFKFLSSYVLHKLIKENPSHREEIYKLVQQSTFESNTIQEFIDKLSESNVIENSSLNYLNGMNESALKKIYLNDIDNLYNKVTEEYN